MSTIINATTTNGVVIQPDNSGSLVLQTNSGTTALTIDTSQRAAFVAGTAALPAITTTGDTNTGVFFPAADTIAFAEGGTEAMRLDSSGNVGIGATPKAWATDIGLKALQISSTGCLYNYAFGGNNFTTVTDNSFLNSGGSPTYITTNTASQYVQSAGTHRWSNVASGTAGDAITFVERMRIDSSGNVLVGTTGISTGTFKGFQNAAGGADANYLSRNSSGTANRQWSFGMNSQDQYVVYGYNTTSFNTGAYIAWGGTSWTASSDERLKDIIEPITDAVNKVSTLRTVIGKYKTDEEGTRRPFLIAQDVQKVLPEAVDATNPEKLGVSYTDVIPLLVASIKEQQQIITDLKATVDAQVATINDLKARVETLEAK